MFIYSAKSSSKVISIVANITVSSITNALMLMFNSVLLLSTKRPIPYIHFTHVLLYIVYLYSDNSNPVIRAHILEFLKQHKVPLLFQKLVERVPKSHYIHEDFVIIRFILPSDIINLVENHYNSMFMLDELIEVNRLCSYYKIDLGIFNFVTSYITPTNLVFVEGGSNPGLHSQHRETRIGSDTFCLSFWNFTMIELDFINYGNWFSFPYFVAGPNIQNFELQLMLLESLKWVLSTPLPSPRSKGKQGSSGSTTPGSGGIATPGAVNQPVPPGTAPPPNGGYTNPNGFRAKLNVFAKVIKTLSTADLEKFRVTYDSSKGIISVSDGQNTLNFNV